MDIDNPLFDKLCSIIEEVNPDFDRDNPEDVEILTKSFVLAMQNTKDGEETKNLYFKCVELRQENHIEKIIQKEGIDSLRYELKKLNFEKEILDKRIAVTRKHLN